MLGNFSKLTQQVSSSATIQIQVHFAGSLLNFATYEFEFRA
jgi:hypothetical protein